VNPWVQWPLWQRVLFTNAVTAVGVYLGFASTGFKTSAIPAGFIAVFTMAFVNLMLLVVAPRVHAKKTAGIAAPSPWRVLYEVLAERPFISALLILQLIRMSYATAATFIFFQGPTSHYFRDTPNLQSMTPFIYATGWFMVGVAVLWLSSAVGLWRGYLWAWWLSLILNGSNVVPQLWNLHKFVLDPISLVAVVLLLLRQVRAEFRRGHVAVGEVAR
jgi:hypothetical protein